MLLVSSRLPVVCSRLGFSFETVAATGNYQHWRIPRMARFSEPLAARPSVQQVGAKANNLERALARMTFFSAGDLGHAAGSPSKT